MARPIRIEYEGAVYHVTIRGNERKSLFKTDADWATQVPDIKIVFTLNVNTREQSNCLGIHSAD